MIVLIHGFLVVLMKSDVLDFLVPNSVTNPMIKAKKNEPDVTMD